MKAMKGFIAAVALLLLAFVGVGLLLPRDWAVERTRLLAAPPEEVFPYLQDWDRFRQWSSLGMVEGTRTGPVGGAGATFTWDDPQWGAGVFRLTGVAPLEQVRYQVEVEGGTLRTYGEFAVRRRDGGTELHWREEGSLGWNPLLAWFALGMERMQGQELEKALDRLQALLEG
ncbi:MAG: SRPBCC family protein [Longimicrobiales bacterium]|nr:SRPBCC family protein [Longimicrobiales bacterium]